MNLNDKQKALLSLMNRVSDILDRHGIDYYLYGGSCIGAIRHNGFIPWDDDIDIYLKKDDYYRFIEAFRSENIQDLDFIYPGSFDKWYRPFGMIVDRKDTCYTRPGMFTGGRALGSRIDIMFLDRVRQDDIENYRQDLLLYNDVVTDTFVANPEIYLQRDRYFEYKEREKTEGRAAIEKELRAKLESYDVEDADRWALRFWTPFLINYPLEVLEKPLMHQFADTMKPIPTRPEQSLRIQYGFGWYRVPKEQTAVHNFFDNPGISYNNYYNDIEEFLDEPAAREAALERKRIFLERMPYSKTLEKIKAYGIIGRTMMRLDLENRAELLDEMFESGRYPEYAEVMEPLLMIRGQLAEVKEAERVIPSQILDSWIYSLLACGRLDDAVKLADIYAKDGDGRAIGSDILELLERISELEVCYQDRDREGMRRALDAVDEEHRITIPNCILAEIQLEDTENLEPARAAELIEKCNRHLGFDPDNYDILKKKADIIFYQGYTGDAMTLYDRVHEGTWNGLDLLELESRFGYKERFDSCRAAEGSLTGDGEENGQDADLSHDEEE